MTFNKKNLPRMQKQLTQWGLRLNGLASEVSRAGPRPTSDYQHHITSLQQKLTSASSALRSLREADPRHGHARQAAAKLAWDELESAIEKVAESLTFALTN
jgi:hypothetical protein